MMGYVVRSPEEFGIAVVVTKVVTVKASGTCPMCETPFAVELVAENDNLLDSYTCPCGYFTYNPEFNEVVEDNYAVPKEQWLRRLATNLATTRDKRRVALAASF
jgi:hypothetical protein